MFIVSLTYRNDPTAVSMLPAHTDYLNAQYAAGHFMGSGLRAPGNSGTILARVKCRQHLMEIIENDPFHRSGLVEYEVTEFSPNMVCNETDFPREA